MGHMGGEDHRENFTVLIYTYGSLLLRQEDRAKANTLQS